MISFSFATQSKEEAKVKASLKEEEGNLESASEETNEESAIEEETAIEEQGKATEEEESQTEYRRRRCPRGRRGRRCRSRRRRRNRRRRSRRRRSRRRRSRGRGRGRRGRGRRGRGRVNKRAIAAFGKAISSSDCKRGESYVKPWGGKCYKWKSDGCPQSYLNYKPIGKTHCKYRTKSNWGMSPRRTCGKDEVVQGWDCVNVKTGQKQCPFWWKKKGRNCKRDEKYGRGYVKKQLSKAQKKRISKNLAAFGKAISSSDCKRGESYVKPWGGKCYKWKSDGCPQSYLNYKPIGKTHCKFRSRNNWGMSPRRTCGKDEVVQGWDCVNVKTGKKQCPFYWKKRGRKCKEDEKYGRGAPPRKTYAMPYNFYRRRR